LVIWPHCLLVGWLIGYNKPTNKHTNQPLFVGHNRPYDQHHSNRLIIELKSKYYAVISRHWKFMFKRIFRVSECADACIYTKRAEEKSTSLQVVFWGTRNVFGVPKLPIGILPSKVGRIWCFCIANTFALYANFIFRIIIYTIGIFILKL
jgi:hypothetical protein